MEAPLLVLQSQEKQKTCVLVYLNSSVKKNHSLWLLETPWTPLELFTASVQHAKAHLFASFVSSRTPNLHSCPYMWWTHTMPGPWYLLGFNLTHPHGYQLYHTAPSAGTKGFIKQFSHMQWCSQTPLICKLVWFFYLLKTPQRPMQQGADPREETRRDYISHLAWMTGLPCLACCH